MGKHDALFLRQCSYEALNVAQVQSSSLLNSLQLSICFEITNTHGAERMRFFDFDSKEMRRVSCSAFSHSVFLIVSFFI